MLNTFDSDPDYLIHRRDYFKDLALHYWTNFEKVTHISSCKMVHQIETTLLFGENGLGNDYVDLFSDYEKGTDC